MLKFCVQQWHKNKDKLRSAIQKDKKLQDCEYGYLVKLVVDHIFNEDDEMALRWDADSITEVNNGSYQGTILWMIPLETYQPDEGDYLLTFVNYGSCSGCDTLLHLQAVMFDGKMDNKIVSGFMSLCKDLVCNTVKPYNSGWRNEEIFDSVEEQANE